MGTDLKALQDKQLSPKDIAALPPKQQIKHLLDRAGPVIAKAMPKHMSPERLLQVATTIATTTPALAECYPPSLVGAIMQCGGMGLEPNTVLGHAYLIPFRNKKKNRQDVQVIIGYKGLIDLARRSGQIQSIAAHCVRANDHFRYQYGLTEVLEHIPSEGIDAGEITYFYAVAHMKDGGHAFEVMSKAKVDQIASNTQSGGKSGPWRDHYEEMGRKTAIRRLAKFLPISIDLARAVALDESAEDGRDQALDMTLEGVFDTVPDDSPEADLLDPPVSDANGEIFDPSKHSQNADGPIFNTDGSFKKRRGTGPRAAANQPTAAEPDPGAVPDSDLPDDEYEYEETDDEDDGDSGASMPPADIDSFGSME